MCSRWIAASGLSGSTFDSYGGAVYVGGGSFQLNSSIAAFNRIDTLGPRTRAAAQAYGAAVCIGSSTPFFMKNSVFVGNTAASNSTAAGGAFYSNSIGTILSSRISDNRALGRTLVYGGGLALLVPTSLELRNVSARAKAIAKRPCNVPSRLGERTSRSKEHACNSLGRLLL